MVVRVYCSSTRAVLAGSGRCAQPAVVAAARLSLLPPDCAAAAVHVRSRHLTHRILAATLVEAAERLPVCASCAVIAMRSRQNVDRRCRIATLPDRRHASRRGGRGAAAGAVGWQPHKGLLALLASSAHGHRGDRPSARRRRAADAAAGGGAQASARAAGPGLPGPDRPRGGRGLLRPRAPRPILTLP